MPTQCRQSERNLVRSRQNLGRDATGTTSTLVSIQRRSFEVARGLKADLTAGKRTQVASQTKEQTAALLKSRFTFLMKHDIDER